MQRSTVPGEHSPKECIYNHNSFTGDSGNIAEQRTEKLQEPEDQEVYWEIVS